MEIIGSMLMIAVISALFVWYGVAAGHREDREERQRATGGATPSRAVVGLDPDAHLGRCGTE